MEQNELEMEIWAVVTHNAVLLSNVTYSVAATYIKGLGADYASDATIVVGEVALRQQARKDAKV